MPATPPARQKSLGYLTEPLRRSERAVRGQLHKSLGIDIGKETFPIVAFDSGGQIVLRKKINRLTLESEFEKLPPSIVGLEPCLGAHFVSRMLRRLGHRFINCQDQGARDTQLRTCDQ